MTWHDVERHFREAVELPPAERDRYLAAALAGDRHALERVRELIRAHEQIEAGEAAFDETLDPERAVRLLGGEAGTPRREGPRYEPGDVVARYRILRTLGRGGAGVVYLAHDPELDRPVALKVLPAPADLDAEAPDPLLEEARAASALDHPNIGTVYEVGRTDNGDRYIAMTPYDEGTLRDRLRAGPLPPEQALEVARQVARGLATAHAAGVVHRDVKPENLVFDRRGTAKLVDFGLAAPGGAGAGGTPAYMSPEQRRGGAADARSDVWAFGVLVYEMLTGRRPEAKRPDAARSRATLEGLPPDTSPELVLLVRRCLEPDPADRPASGDALVRVLNPVKGNLRPTVRGLQARAPWVWAAAGVVLMAGVGWLMGRSGLPRVVDAQGSAEGAFPERGWVVVADFDAADGADDLALAAREALAVDLQQSEFVRVVSRAQLVPVLARMGVPPSAPLDLPRAMEAAERFGAGAVLGATIARAGPDYVLSGRALDPRTGAEYFAVRTTASEDRLLGAVEELAREMRARLGEDRRALARSLPLPEVTTTSIEALRLYAEAERLLPIDAERAGALAAAAVEADSTFAMAHRLAAAAASGLLRFGETSRHLERAYRFRERLPERERWHVEAIHASNVAFEPGRGEEFYELIVQRYPDDWRAWHNLGVLRQGWLDDHQGAYDAFQRALVLDSTNVGGLGNAVQIAYIAGYPDEADRLAEAAERLGAAGSILRWRALRSFAEGNSREAIDACDRLLGLDAPGSVSADDLEVCGSIDVALGRHEPGERRLVQVRDRYLERGRHRNATHAAQALALSRLVQGDTVGAERHLEWVLEGVPVEALEEPDLLIVRTNLMVQAHLFGLHEIAARAQQTYPPFPDAEHWFARHGRALVEGAAAVAAGDGPRAVQALEAPAARRMHPIGWRIWDELVRGRAYELVGDAEASARHLEAAADARFYTLPFATKDRVHGVWGNASRIPR